MTGKITFEAKAEVGLEDVAAALAAKPEKMGALMAAVAERLGDGEAVDYWFEALEDVSHFTFQFLAAGVVGEMLKAPARRDAKKAERVGEALKASARKDASGAS